MSADLVNARRARVLEAMAAAGIDLLVLGRQDNAGYACGMRRLWTAGTRPFGAGCIVVGSTGRVHALSSWDDGLEPPMSFEDLYPLTWNPRIMAASMAGVDGLAGADRIGVDELTPSFRRAAAGFAPGAEVVPADDLMAAVRRHKLPGEVEAISRACAVAWVGVEAALGAPGGTDPEVAAITALAGAGVTVPSSGVRAERRDGGLAVDVGVICDLVRRGSRRLVRRRLVRRVGSTPLVEACRDGASHTDLAPSAACMSAGGPATGWCAAWEWASSSPVIGPGVGAGERLDAGMVLSVTDGDRRDVDVSRVVHVTVAGHAEGPAVLSQRP